MSKREERSWKAFRKSLIQLARATGELDSPEKKQLVSWLKSASHDELSFLLTDLKNRLKKDVTDVPNFPEAMKAHIIADIDRSTGEDLLSRLTPEPDRQLQSTETHGMVLTPEGGLVALIAGLFSFLGSERPKGPFGR